MKHFMLNTHASYTHIPLNGKACLLFLIMVSILTACSPVKTPIANQYMLKAFYSTPSTAHANEKHSIFVSQPDATSGFQTEQMLYTNKPFEINAFAHNAWISTPSNMLYPLITQSLQKSHYFYAVASGSDIDKTEYRLDTQILSFHQNFLVKPSMLELTVQSMLTHVEDNRLVASHTFTKQIPCPSDTPYGGVLAANQATYALTKSITQFVINHIRHDGRASQ